MEATTECEKALSLVHQGKFEEALNAFESAEKACEKEDNTNWLNFARHERMHSLIRLGRYHEAIELADEVKKNYLKAGNYKSTVLLITHVAECHFLDKELEHSLEWLQIAKLLANSEKINELNAYIHSHLAKVWIELKQFYLAYKTLEKAKTTYKKNSEEWAWCTEQIGVCAEKLFNYTLAEHSLVKVYHYYMKHNKLDDALRNCQALENLYNQQDKKNKAEYWQQQTIKISQTKLTKAF